MILRVAGFRCAGGVEEEKTPLGVSSFGWRLTKNRHFEFPRM